MMNNEEFERKMAFIVDQQVKFAVGIERMMEVQVQIQTSQAQTENIVARLAYATLEGFKDVNVKIDALVDAQIRLNDSQARTEDNLRRTDESLRQTDETLRRFIIKVDRLVDERRTGKQ